MKKPFLLARPYFPYKSENRMCGEGDVVAARQDYLKYRPGNLSFLLEKRYRWMDEFVRDGSSGIEVGCGTGLSRAFLHTANYLLTDTVEHPWVDRILDATDMPFGQSSLDFILSSNMIHHLAHPSRFFDECARVLRPGGRLIIQEINASLLMRLILRIMRHEGYSFSVDVFDRTAVCNDPSDPWSANCAIPNLLFDDMETFHRNFPCWKAIHHRYTECLIFPLSGGVIAKSKTIQLPRRGLELVDRIDDLLIRLSRSIFPLQRQLVLERT